MRALVTGGAGFIGSHIVDRLLAEGNRVRVLDDLSTGLPGQPNPAAELEVGDVAEEEVVRKAMEGIDVVFHHAAHRAVLRSVEEPLSTDRANTYGTLTVLKTAADCHVRRVIFASSSSIYGGAEHLPTAEHERLRPRSPYAVSKLAGEEYCRVFTELYGLETVSLRYFNVYGPRQPVASRYAAVIPLFVRALAVRDAPIIHGDGNQSRDFTYVGDAVEATMLAASAPAQTVGGRAYNVAGGRPCSILDLLGLLARITGFDPTPNHAAARAGDVRHTWADTSAATRDFHYEPRTSLEDGLRRTVRWFGGLGSAKSTVVEGEHRVGASVDREPLQEPRPG